MKHSLEVKDIYKKQFEKMKRDKIRFSITIDEYTSSRTRRFVNIDVHVKIRHWNLGMIRIFGSIPADKAVTVVREKLKEFGNCLNSDIVAAINEERRNPETNLLIYLNDPETLNKQSTNVFHTLQMKRNALANTNAKLFCRLHEESNECNENKLEEKIFNLLFKTF